MIGTLVLWLIRAADALLGLAVRLETYAQRAGAPPLDVIVEGKVVPAPPVEVVEVPVDATRGDGPRQSIRWN